MDMQWIRDDLSRAEIAALLRVVAASCETL